MSMQIAPYHNAMRLGQGFNSYTQRICIDDAVVIDADRAENVITNDGTTMRIVAEKSGSPSVWTRQPEVASDGGASVSLRSARTENLPDLTEDLQEVEENTGAAADEIDNNGSPVQITHGDAVQPMEDTPASDSNALTQPTEAAPAEDVKGPVVARQSQQKQFGAPRTGQPRRRNLAQSKKAEDAKQDEERRRHEARKIEAQRLYEVEIEKEDREEERKRREEDRNEQQQIRKEKREFDKQRREDMRQAIQKAADLKATSLDDLKKIAAQNQFAERFAGIYENTSEAAFNANASRGPSQVVTYTSRFVDRLSDITDDMCISGSLSIKSAKIGGSGKGSFVDSDKFKESDLNFYISVKVVNHTVNFKDALVYNPVRSVGEKDASAFNQVFGDSFISGFIEGGEFNALVSMKILNKAKKTDIQAEAKVALTAGPIDLEAQANVGIARSNLETNTETTIQVSWAGGGHIKPSEQQWDIKSLMQAASRFPDLVATCPQRTYAILSKYETLRSFVARKPASYTKLQYENAQIYTNVLMDAFMSYKALYKRLSEQIFGIQGRTLEIKAWGTDETSSPTGQALDKKQASDKRAAKKDPKSGIYPYEEDLTRFEASIKGLSDARVAIRRQMARISTEVDLIETDPKLATDEDHQEPYQAPLAFESRLPVVEVPDRLKRRANPLSGRAIKAKEVTEDEQNAELAREDELAGAPPLYTAECKLTSAETAALDLLKDERPGIGNDFRVSSAVGSENLGTPFNNLDILKSDWTASVLRVQVSKGIINYIAVSYRNGLLIEKGNKRQDAKSFFFGPLPAGERVVSASIETGILSEDHNKNPCVLALGLFTNRGKTFLASAATGTRNGKFTKENPNDSQKPLLDFEEVNSRYLEVPIDRGNFKGFFGRSDDGEDGKIWRLGIIWGASLEVNSEGTDGQPLSLTGLAVTTDSNAARSGVLTTTDKWKKDQADAVERIGISFSPAFAQPPLMLQGLGYIDLDQKKDLHISSGVVNVSTSKATATLQTTGQWMYGIGMCWLAIPQRDYHIEAGTYEFLGDEPKSASTWTGKAATVPFSRSFKNIPTVRLWSIEVKSVGSSVYSSWTSTQKETGESFDLKLQVKDESGLQFKGQRVGWLAYDAVECPHIQSGEINTMSEDYKKNRRVTFKKAFTKPPAVFVALNSFHAGSETNLRLKGQYSNVTGEGFSADVGNWGGENDNKMIDCWYTWVAVGS